MADITGRYVRFDQKVDNSNQVISANDINTIQDTTERVEQGIFAAQDRDFLDKALFILEHHRTLNGLWLDLFEDVSKIDLPKSTNLVFSEVERGIVFPDASTATQGILYSRTYINPNGSNMQKVMVIAAGYVPDGANIKIEVSNNQADWFEISTTDGAIFEIPTDGTSLKLRATITRADSTIISPRLDAWAMLYYDVKQAIIDMPDGSQVIISDPNDPIDPNQLPDVVKIMHGQLLGIGPNDHHDQEHTHDGTDGSGLISHDDLTDIGTDDHHPMDHQHGLDGVDFVNLQTDVTGTLSSSNLSYQVWLGKPGRTGLFFDPKLNDRLVYVKTPDDESYLFYDLVNDRLDHTITIREGVAAWEAMIYGEYTTSTGSTTIVLQGTEKTMYDATDAVIQNEIDKATAPDAPLGLVVTDPGSGGRLDLTWQQSPELDIVGYNVYKSSDGGITWAMVNTTGTLGVNNYNALGLVNGVEVLYAITAVDASGYESARSMAVTGTPTLADTIAPNQPQSISAVSISGGSINIEWNLNVETDLANYKVYRSYSGAGGTFALLANVDISTNLYVDTGLLVGNTYFYYVTAIDTNGNESVPSIIVSTMA